jgi:DNA-binding IclR family transcriptional regulator
MTVRDTSRAAYEDHKASMGTTRQQQQILDTLQKGRDYSLQEISKLTAYPINVVSGRVNEMKKNNILEEAPRRKCSITQKTIHPVRLPASE